MLKNKSYYHISPIENKDSILLNGLKSDYNQIFVSNKLEQLPLIAYNQIFTYEYSVFKIDVKGINGKIEKDNVAELGSNYQFIINQNHIKPEYISHIEDKKWNEWDLAEYHEGLRAKVMGYDIESRIIYFEEWVEYYNKKYGKDLVCIIHNEKL